VENEDIMIGEIKKCARELKRATVRG